MLCNVALATALFVGLATSQAAAPTAQTKNGTYVGVYSAEYDQDFFLGVPYAQPPVGSLRFRNPVPLNTTFSEPKPAAQYSSEVGHLFQCNLLLLTCAASAMAMVQTNGTTRFRKIVCTSTSFVQQDSRTRISLCHSGSTAVDLLKEEASTSATTSPLLSKTL